MQYVYLCLYYIQKLKKINQNVWHIATKCLRNKDQILTLNRWYLKRGCKRIKTRISGDLLVPGIRIVDREPQAAQHLHFLDVIRTQKSRLTENN